MKIVEAHQVPMGNVSPDIFALPCVYYSVKKKNGIEYGVFVNGTSAYPSIALAFPTNWICKDENGEWLVLDDYAYQLTKIEQQ